MFRFSTLLAFSFLYIPSVAAVDDLARLFTWKRRKINRIRVCTNLATHEYTSTVSSNIKSVTEMIMGVKSCELEIKGTNCWSFYLENLLCDLCWNFSCKLHSTISNIKDIKEKNCKADFYKSLKGLFYVSLFPQYRFFSNFQGDVKNIANFKKCILKKIGHWVSFF